MLSDKDCAEFPGPRWYEPKSVPRALALLRSVRSEADARAAYDSVLFAVGNNHAGSLYPIATAAVHDILRIIAEQSGWSRSAALEILGELLRFAPDPGFSTFRRGDGASVDVSLEIVLAVRGSAQLLLRIFENPDTPACDRENALSVLALAYVDVERTSRTVRSVLDGSVPRRLRNECLDYLKSIEETRLVEGPFIMRIRSAFPSPDPSLTRVMINQACELSPNAAFAALFELAHAPSDSPATRSERLEYLELFAAQLHHPLATAILPIARRMLEQRPLSVSEALASMRVVEEFPGQEQALRIASFCGSDDAAEVGRERLRILDAWAIESSSHSDLSSGEP